MNCITMNGKKVKVEMDYIEQTAVLDYLWSMYVKSGSPAFEKAHILLACLFNGKVEGD